MASYYFKDIYFIGKSKKLIYKATLQLMTHDFV